MSEKTIKYSIKDLEEIEFKNSMRGYKVSQVENFLENVIEDYEYFQEQINILTIENQNLKNLNKGIDSNLFNNQNNNDNKFKETINSDILQRISNLERLVLGNKNKK